MSNHFQDKLQRLAAEAAHIDSRIPFEHLIVASAAAAAIAAKFDLQPDQVRVIPVPDGTPCLAAVYTGTGLYEGSWEEIQATDTNEVYKLDIGGIACDSRSGMSYRVYRAMYRVLSTEANAQGRLCLADYLSPDDPAYEPRTHTWLTAHPAANSLAPIGIVRHDGQTVECGTKSMYGDYSSIRFRPAVIIGPKLVDAYFDANPGDADMDTI